MFTERIIVNNFVREFDIKSYVSWHIVVYIIE